MSNDPYSRKPPRLERHEELREEPFMPEGVENKRPQPSNPPPRDDDRLVADNAAYLTLITWPDGYDRQNMASLLVQTGVVELASANLLVARSAPFVVGLYDKNTALAAAKKIQVAGGDAFAPTPAELASFGPTMKIKEMRVVDGNLEIELWRGPSTTIRREQIQLLVRGSVKPTSEKEKQRRVADRVRNIVGDSSIHIGYGAIDPVVNYTMRRITDAAPEPSSFFRVSEKLDIHTTDRSIYQVDGDKFAFTVLGEMKGPADKVNMDRLCELIAHISPNEIVDNYFSLFSAPVRTGLLMRVVPGMMRNSENPDFAFYSRWTALINRHVMNLQRR